MMGMRISHNFMMKVGQSGPIWHSVHIYIKKY